MELFPAIVSELSLTDKVNSDRVLQMFELMGQGNFPYDNISFLLFEDVIQWFTSDYSPETKLFWATGHKLLKRQVSGIHERPFIQKF